MEWIGVLHPVVDRARVVDPNVAVNLFVRCCAANAGDATNCLSVLRIHVVFAFSFQRERKVCT